MIDVQNGKYSFASVMSKAKTSALRAALHISPAYADCGLTGINHPTKHAMKRTNKLHLQSNCRLS